MDRHRKDGRPAKDDSEVRDRALSRLEATVDSHKDRDWGAEVVPGLTVRELVDALAAAERRVLFLARYAHLLEKSVKGLGRRMDQLESLHTKHPN